MMEKLLDYIAGHQMEFLLAGAFLFIGLWAFRLHTNKDIDFNLLDLFMESGRISKAATVMMFSFILTSWMMVYLTLHDKLTEGYLGLYAAIWIAPVVIRLVTNAPHTPHGKRGTATTLPTLPSVAKMGNSEGIAAIEKAAKDE